MIQYSTPHDCLPTRPGSALARSLSAARALYRPGAGLHDHVGRRVRGNHPVRTHQPVEQQQQQATFRHGVMRTQTGVSSDIRD